MYMHQRQGLNCIPTVISYELSAYDKILPYSDIMSAHLKFDLTSIKVVLTWPFMFKYIYNYFELKFQQHFLISVTLRYYTL